MNIRKVTTLSSSRNKDGRGKGRTHKYISSDEYVERSWELLRGYRFEGNMEFMICHITRQGGKYLTHRHEVSYEDSLDH